MAVCAEHGWFMDTIPCAKCMARALTAAVTARKDALIREAKAKPLTVDLTSWDDLAIPAFLLRGHPDNAWLKTQETGPVAGPLTPAERVAAEVSSQNERALAVWRSRYPRSLSDAEIRRIEAEQREQEKAKREAREARKLNQGLAWPRGPVVDRKKLKKLLHGEPHAYLPRRTHART